MRYDIVLVSYNSVRWLEPCVQALSRLDYDLSQLNLVFVDNASTDDTVNRLHALKQQYPGFGGFEIVESGKNSGFGAGCNLGAAQGSAPLVFFLNLDTAIFPDALQRLDETIAETGPEVVAFEMRQLPFEHGKLYDPVALQTNWCSGAAVVVRRPAFEAVGGFDAHIFMYGEDVDLSWRLRAVGGVLQYVPRARVMHFTNQKEGGNAFEYLCGQESQLLLHYKYSDAIGILKAEKHYLQQLCCPPHFPHVRKKLLKAYLEHFIKLWPFLLWRFRSGIGHTVVPANFEQDFCDNRGQQALILPQSRPLVSVIIRTTQQPDMLRETLQSLRNQTYSNFEVVVVEDGPCAAKQLLEQEFSDLNWQYHHTGQRIGRGRAGNLGLAMARGELCNFLDQDDYFYADHLETLVACFEQNPQTDIVFGSAMELQAEVISRNPYRLQTKSIEHLANVRLDTFLFCRNCLAPIQTVMFRHTLFEQLGGLHEELDGGEDWYMWLKYLTVARRTNQREVDIKRATSVYYVPAGQQAAQARVEQYAAFYKRIFEDEKLCYQLTARQLRDFYRDFLNDIAHLNNTGQLTGFIEAQRRNEF